MTIIAYCISLKRIKKLVVLGVVDMRQLLLITLFVKGHLFISLHFDVSHEKGILSPSPYNMASSCTNDDGSVPFNKALHHVPVTQRTLWTPIFSKIAQAGVPWPLLNLNWSL